MKKKVGTIFCVLLYILGLYVLLSPAISDLNSKDVHTVNLSAAGQMMVLEHSINGLIPTGKDYYYIGCESQTFDAYVIHAPKGWLKKNFKEDMIAIDSNGVTVTGVMKEPSYRIARELKTVAVQLEGVNFPYGSSNVLEINYKSHAIIRIILFGLSLLLGLLGLYIHKNREKMSIKFIYVHRILCIITLCFVAKYI